MTDTFFLTALISLASYRAWRIVGLDDWPPSRWLRGQLKRLSGADSGLVATRANRFWTEVETFATCPWCLGAYATAGVVIAVDCFTSVPLPVLVWAAASSIVGLVGSNLDG